MPKQVDREARRTQIAEALLRVAARDGLGQVSLRHVAAEAGVSMGLIQHYFRTKDEMMTFALGVVSENTQRRLAAEAPDPDDPRALIRALLHQMVPVDDERLREGHATLAYAAYTAVRPEIAAGLREQMAQLRDHIAASVGGDAGQAAARTLLALVDGLMLHVIGGVITGEDAQRVLDAQLDATFGV